MPVEGDGGVHHFYDRLDKKKARDLRVVRHFLSIYCREKHRDENRTTFPVWDERLHLALGDGTLLLCNDCQRLFNHAIAKRLICPYEPKPTCRRCKTHCYAPGYREKIRQVMRFSGWYLVRHGRLDLLAHYLH